MSPDEPERTNSPDALRADLEAERRRRLAAEEALRSLEDRHRLLLEGAKDYAVVLLDADGRIADWNEGARRLVGYEADEVVGQSYALLFTAEDRARGRPEAELRRAAADGKSADENWIVRKGGSRFWASGITTQLPPTSGRPGGFVKVFRDLTERRRAQEALRDRDERLRVALAAARLGTWLWDLRADRQILDESLGRLLGLPAGETVEDLEGFLGRVHPEDRALVRQAFERVARGEGDLRIEFRVPWPDGSLHWLRDQGDLVRDADGRPLYLTGACADISDRKALEAALRQSHDELERRVEERTAELRQAQERALQAERLAAIGQTVAGLAHESGNALQTIRACCERLSWRLPERPDALALVQEIQTAEETLQRLFADVRDYAAPLRLECRLLDLAPVWREAWAQALARHPGRDARLEERKGGTDLTCEADAFRLGQVFTNILDNGLAAGPESVRVTITCSEADLAGRPALRVAVRDNGPGLAAEAQRRIFEPFYTTKTKGTGLGMAIARRVVEAHGGSIAVGEPGPGAEIILTLPRRRP